ncbi:hypothetical protein GCM10009665_43450 [Kitasatospora nipponensis]|uniref:SH3 domain-containing protein n=1 Tax=Kitasatospora nipponensis TaxID=258049 RepID=A0ABN1WGS7_9ACTN
MSIRTSTVVGLTATVLGVGALGFTIAPSVGELAKGRHVEESNYATGAQAKGARATMPRWLPDGATAVHYRISTTNGDRSITAQLPDGLRPTGCSGGAAPAPAVPVKLSTARLPAGAGSKVAINCGSYRVVVDGRDLYAWQTGADWVAVNLAGLQRR